MTEPKRRTKTKATGVYKSISGTYEIAYRDSDGKLVFRVVDGGFEDAKAARAEIVGNCREASPFADPRRRSGPSLRPCFLG